MATTSLIPGGGGSGFAPNWYEEYQRRVAAGEIPAGTNPIQPTSTPSAPVGGPTNPTTSYDPGTPAFGGWTGGNIFDSWDLSPLSAKTGVARDTLADQRDAFLGPLQQQFRTASAQAGYRPDAGDANLFNDPQFRAFVQQGQAPYALGQKQGLGQTQAPGAPSLFDDPSTRQLEAITNAQMGEVRNNPGLNQLLTFLDSQFADLSQHPGFSPQEMAVLNTQAFEPIEDLRKASTERSLQRTASRGFLPSSGLAELDLRQIDRDADRLRTQANRDLSINAIDRRDADLNRALQYATTRGLTIPQGQRAEELNLSNLLYQLPRNALTDALAVLNGSPTSADLLSGAQSSAYQQQLQRQQTAEMWRQIAALIGSLNL